MPPPSRPARAAPRTPGAWCGLGPGGHDETKLRAVLMSLNRTSRRSSSTVWRRTGPPCASGSGPSWTSSPPAARRPAARCSSTSACWARARWLRRVGRPNTITQLARQESSGGAPARGGRAQPAGPPAPRGGGAGARRLPPSLRVDGLLLAARDLEDLQRLLDHLVQQLVRLLAVLVHPDLLREHVVVERRDLRVVVLELGQALQAPAGALGGERGLQERFGVDAEALLVLRLRCVRSALQQRRNGRAPGHGEGAGNLLVPEPLEDLPDHVLVLAGLRHV